MLRPAFFTMLCFLVIPLCTAQQNQKKSGGIFRPSSSETRSVQSFLYSLTTYTDTYTDLAGATSLNNGEIWDEPDYIMPLGFPFLMNGHTVSALEFYGSGSLMRSPTEDPDFDVYIFPFEADLIDRGANGGTSLSPISYTIEGTPGNRIQKMEFKNAGSYYEMDLMGTLNMYVNFQMWLFEGSNKIEYHFGPHFINDPNLFYDDSGPGTGISDYDEADDIIDHPHFIIGPAANPNLSENPILLTGTPADGMVYQLTVIEPLSISVTGMDGNSFCDPDGSAMVVASGGTEPYTYFWNTGETTSTIFNLDAGTYSVTVTDADGAFEEGSVIISNAVPMNLVMSGTDETSLGANDGTAEVQVTGGTSPYTYLWTNNETTAMIENLAPGVYTVVVSDASGCTADGSVTVNPYDCPTLTLEAALSHPSCFGECTGSINILQIGQGTAPFSFLWDNGNTTPLIVNLCAGDYSITVTDANGCMVIGNYSITEPDHLLANATAAPESLFNQHDGMAWAIPSGGTTPYTYEWSNGSTDSLITNLGPGNYTVTVTDNNLCSASETVIVNVGPCGVLNSELIGISCFGDCDGAIIAGFPNGVPPISYLWNTGDTVSMISDLCSGSYSITVTDSTGCVVMNTYMLDDPAPLETNGGSTDETINLNDGTAWVSPSGGNPPYVYLWNNGSQDSLMVNLAPGEYFVTVTDDNGCASAESIIVNAFTCISFIQIGYLPISCFGACDGTLSLNVQGGNGPFSFLWNTGDTIPALNMVCAGIYEVTVTDIGQGCSSSASIELDEPNLLSINVDNVIHLSDTTITAIEISLTGGTPPFAIAWSGPNNYSSNEEDLQGILPGFYSVLVTDANGCQAQVDSIEVVDQTVGISTLSGLNPQITPNPARNIILVQGIESNDLVIQLYTHTGVPVSKWKNTTSLSVEDMVPGAYLLKLTTGNKVSVLPLLIIR